MPVVLVSTAVGGGGDYKSSIRTVQNLQQLHQQLPTTQQQPQSSQSAKLTPQPPSVPSSHASSSTSSSSSSHHKFIPQLPLAQLALNQSTALSNNGNRLSPPPSDIPSTTPLPLGKFGVFGFVDGPLESALFNDPRGIALQLSSEDKTKVEALFVADTGNHAIRKVDLSTGMVQTIACKDNLRPTILGSPATAASSSSAGAPSPFPVILPLHYPTDLVLDPAQAGAYCIVVDSGNHVLRKIQLKAMLGEKLSKVSLWAGGGGEGATNFRDDNEGDEEGNEKGDGNDDDAAATGESASTASSSTSSFPPSPARPSTASSRSTASGSTTLSALQCRFSHPSGLCWDASQNLWVCDRGNHKLKRINTTRQIGTFSPAPSALSAAASDSNEFRLAIHEPTFITQDGRGQLVFCERSGHCVKRIAADGSLHLLAGIPKEAGLRDGDKFSSPENKDSAALFSGPEGVACETETNCLFVCDSENHCIRMITPNGAVVSIAGAGAISSHPTAAANSQAHAGDSSTQMTSRPSTASTHRSTTSASDISSATSPTAFSTPTATEPEEGYVNGVGGQARFFRPTGIAYHQGVLFVVDTGNHCVRTVKVSNPTSGSSSSFSTLSSTSPSPPASSFSNLVPADPFPSARLLQNDNSTSMSRFPSMPSLIPSGSATSRPTTAKQSSRSNPDVAAPSTTKLQLDADASAVALSALQSVAPPPLVSDWSRVDVSFWVLSLGTGSSFEKYSDALYQAKITGATLMDAHFDEAALGQLVKGSLHRKTIWREILRLRQEQRSLQRRQGSAGRHGRETGAEAGSDNDFDGDEGEEADEFSSDSSASSSIPSSRIGSASTNRNGGSRFGSGALYQPNSSPLLRPHTPGGWREKNAAISNQAATQSSLVHELSFLTQMAKELPKRDRPLQPQPAEDEDDNEPLDPSEAAFVLQGSPIAASASSSTSSKADVFTLDHGSE